MNRSLRRLLPVLSLLCCLHACASRTEITVLSREEGSGTRSAFVTRIGAAEGGLDRTTPRAEINSSTAVVVQTVVGNPNAIGYISLGALNPRVKALRIDGVAPGVAAIRDGRYPISRAFYAVTKGTADGAAEEFLQFILSDAGQAIVTANGYVSVPSGGPFLSAAPRGTVTVQGSSSVSPVMEKLAEAYEAVNPAVKVQLQTSDSSTGIAAAGSGLCDIGISSRELTDDELAGGLRVSAICHDGIAVIVNRDNPVEDLTLAQLRAIYTGSITQWTMLSQQDSGNT